MDMVKYLDLFVSEANEHIQAAGSEAARLVPGPAPPEQLNSLFRHFHSIKGMAAAMGFEPIASLSHAVEDLFDALRKGAATPDAPLAELVVEALDATAAMVADAARSPGAPLASNHADLIGRIRALVPAAPRRAAAAATASGGMREGTAGTPGLTAAERRRLSCRVGVNAGAEFPGARMTLVLRRLAELGRIVSTAPAREILSTARFDGEMTIVLETDRAEAAVRSAVTGLLDLERFEVTVEAAPASPGGAPAESAQGTVRIPTATLDRFLDALSEMIVRRGALARALRTRDLAAAHQTLGRLSESIDALREQVMLIRMMPFEHIAPRLTRAVRELCRATGKRVHVEVAGSEVALDRSVLEELIDPLTHILRNAVDHGIELPAERELAGKHAQGTIRLDVTRQGDRVLVVVADDGRGMDREAIARAAVSGGFVTAEQLAAMDEPEIYQLTTIPGFSTAARVTEVSGRGVGMDVARTRVEALHGHIRISSRRGEGTRIELSVPLTVALIDAFLVDCRAGVFAVPAGSVAGVQLVEPRRVRTTLSGRYIVPSEEDSGTDPSRLTPLITLDEALGASPGGTDAGETPFGGARPFPVLAYEVDGARGALAVNRVRERRELVVRPLGTPLERLRKYSGAALLDDGSVALILDLVNIARS